MTEKDLEDIDTGAGWHSPDDVIDKLVAEVWRLRGLVKDAEFYDAEAGYVVCSWCESGAYYTRPRPTHTADCPAFTPEGELR